MWVNVTYANIKKWGNFNQLQSFYRHCKRFHLLLTVVLLFGFVIYSIYLKRLIGMARIIMHQYFMKAMFDCMLACMSWLVRTRLRCLWRKSWNELLVWKYVLYIYYQNKHTKLQVLTMTSCLLWTHESGWGYVMFPPMLPQTSVVSIRGLK